MSHFTQAQVGQASFSSFSITQSALGSPLEFEPALGSQQLDDLINNYVAGNATTQQKRARVVLEFLNSIDAYSYQHPVCLHYYAPLSTTSQLRSRESSIISSAHKTSKNESANASEHSSSLKRVRQEPSFEETSSAKRLPGFSILTRDGIDITEYASRGPKTKEQRDHAALMRKLKACAACKRSKQRCDPSHHRPAPSALGTSSTYSARNISFSSSSGSRESVSPLSSLGESFNQSPIQSFASGAVAHAGQRFSSSPTPNLNLSPSDFTLPGTPFIDPILSLPLTQNVDSELFQLTDGEDVSLFDYLSQDSSNEGNYSAWSSPDNFLSPVQNNELPAMPNTTWRIPPGNSSSPVTIQTHAHTPPQNYDPQSVLCQTIVSVNELEKEFDINECVRPSLDSENNASLRPRRRRPLSEQEHDEIMTVRKLESCYLCKSRKAKCTHGLPSSTVLGNHTGISHGILREAQNSQVNGSLADSRSQQLQLSRSYQYQDYVLYPDSGDFNMGLEADQIFRDVASTRWPLPCGYSASVSERQSIDSSLSPRQTTMNSALQAVITADALYNEQSSTSNELSYSADAERHSFRNNRRLDSECGYQTLSSNGPRRNADSRLLEVPIANIHTPNSDTDNQIPSDNRHILRVGDLIPDANHTQQTEASHNQSAQFDQSTPSREHSYRYTARSSQEDDISLSQDAGNATEQSLLKYLERRSNQASLIGEESNPAITSSLGSSLTCYTILEDLSTSPGQSLTRLEDESKHEPVLRVRQECLQQTEMFFDPLVLGQYVENRGNDRFKKMDVFVRLCILMAISIFATISLLVVGSDYAIDSVSGSFLQEIVSLYCGLPEFHVSGTYRALEIIATEPNAWIKYDQPAEPGLDATSHSYYHGIPYSGYRNSESYDIIDSWPVISETGLIAFGASLNDDTNGRQMKDATNELLDRSRTYGAPTTTIFSPTVLPTMTSAPKSSAIDAMPIQSEASFMKESHSLLQRRTSLLKRSLNRNSILGDITLRMTSLRIS